uniref:Uncharacterized protein n=1 Tax=Meloidogyne javanica TaxID=6303 RepID=A0A915LJW2_MELJA
LLQILQIKRFATIAIGFVLSGNPELCLSHSGMLSKHINGHIRYGAAIALGIACAGSGYKESVSRLEPLLQAKENFVRQGALIALSFVLIQHTESTCSNVVEFRKTITKTITEKSEDTITKFGAIVAQGILDAGGRNVTLYITKEEFEHQQKELEAIRNPIISKLYQSAGGAGMPGGMPCDGDRMGSLNGMCWVRDVLFWWGI